MRADRLLSLLMILQARGKVTAGDLARKLEVSERTIYRDIDALSRAGVPVYGEPGPEGGFALVDRFRTNLTGLTDAEVRALFMLSVPAPLADLGVSQELRAALRKLAASLPDEHRQDEVRARRRYHLDATWWRQGGEPVPHLRTIHGALWQDRKLAIVYQPLFGVEMERVVCPYGLVAKAGIWHLVCARAGADQAVRRVSVHRVSRLRDVRLSDETFQFPADFDLARFWEGWCQEYESLLRGFTTTVRVAPDVVQHLVGRLGQQFHEQAEGAGPPDADGWVTLELSFESLEAARERILSFGRGIEVLEPPALRRSVLDFAEQIVDLYTDALVSPA